ncbi:cytochrome P450 [Conexibacter sp. W3-3-2]|uniref:cytochrome P450 n=1 Tax=Conexibacter sp. W3-3-2 TaxID=2675227 RepID=UPI001E4AC69B|nr:cytochrome P450 [Conexibacter sp. W3-3-2]
MPLFVQQQQMISMDPPRHDRLKQLVGKAFTPNRIASHEAHVRKIVNGGARSGGGPRAVRPRA